MRLDLDHLPHDTALLHQLVRDLAARVEQRDGEIEKLRLIVRQLQRGQFGPRSEWLDPDQLQLGLEDLDADIAHAETGQLPTATADKTNREHRPRRLAFPEHLPREEVKLDLNTRACPGCGGALHSIGETTSECSIGYLPRCASSALVGPNTGAGPAVRSTRSLRPSASSPRAWRRPASLHRSWSANTAITCRSIVRPGSSLATASSSTARHWRTGSAAPAGGWSRCMPGSRQTSSPPPSSSPMIRRSRCSTPAVVGPRQAGCGSIRETIGRGPVHSRRRLSTSTALIVRLSDRRLTSAALKASCRSMAMPGSSA